jgi:ribonuclease HII
MYQRCGFRYEKKLRAIGVVRIAGIDEAGRGALAGPVVAAAVILPDKFRHGKLNDSKQLAPELREEVYVDLTSHGEIAWAVGVVDHLEIDRINILRATHRAMRDAIAALISPPEHVLIDGLPVIPFPLPQTAIIDGDCYSKSIAAASVIAKVTRDRIMREFCARFPEYCFSQHKGYGTELHLSRLHELGPCPIHRRSFEPVAQPLLALEGLVKTRASAARREWGETGLQVPAAERL